MLLIFSSQYKIYSILYICFEVYCLKNLDSGLIVAITKIMTYQYHSKFSIGAQYFANNNTAAATLNLIKPMSHTSNFLKFELYQSIKLILAPILKKSLDI